MANGRLEVHPAARGGRSWRLAETAAEESDSRKARAQESDRARLGNVVSADEVEGIRSVVTRSTRLEEQVSRRQLEHFDIHRIGDRRQRTPDGNDFAVRKCGTAPVIRKATPRAERTPAILQGKEIALSDVVIVTDVRRAQDQLHPLEVPEVARNFSDQRHRAGGLRSGEPAAYSQPVADKAGGRTDVGPRRNRGTDQVSREPAAV